MTEDSDPTDLRAVTGHSDPIDLRTLIGNSDPFDLPTVTGHSVPLDLPTVMDQASRSGYISPAAETVAIHGTNMIGEYECSAFVRHSRTPGLQGWSTAALSLALLAVSLLAVSLLAAPAMAQSPDQVEAAISAVIDDFHDAAWHGDKKRYLGDMTDDGVFLGTDETERMPKHPTFTNYVNRRFKDGVGWRYRSVARNIQLAASGKFAWFDEVVYSKTNGRFRGTGVVVLTDKGWKIAQYAMSFLVPNDDWDKVIELIHTTDDGKNRTTQ